MRIRKRNLDFAFELRAGQASWFWQLVSLSNGCGIVGAASSADEAVRDACATLEEIDPGACVIEMAPALLESTLTWSGMLERFGGAVGAASARCNQRPA